MIVESATEVARAPEDSWVTQVLKDISPAQPAGEDAEFTELHDAVIDELEKLNSFEPTGAVRWSIVVDRGVELLQTRSKDLRIAAYVAAGMYAQQGARGLARGIALIHGLITRFWEGLHPRDDLDARVQAIAWMLERVAGELAAVRRDALDPRAVNAARSELEALDRALTAALADAAPSTAMVHKALARFASRGASAAGEPAPPPPDKNSPPAQSRASNGRSALAVAPMIEAPPTFDPDALKPTLKRASKFLAQIGAALRRADPQDARAYRFTRAALWHHVERLPADARGRIALPPLPGPLVTRLERMRAAANWIELLEVSESEMVGRPLYLVFQRLSAEALGALGPGYAQALREVERGAARLLERLPELVELKLRDGTPLQDERSRAWALALARGRGGGGEHDGLTEVLAELHEELSGAEPEDAFARLHARLEENAAGRVRFALRRELARLCIKTGNASVGARIYSELFDEISRRGLMTWEPALAGECIVELLRSASALTPGERERLGVLRAHDVLCAARPELAFELTSELAVDAGGKR